jgi:hypothetical protein
MDNVANYHVDHPISPKPLIMKATKKKVLVSPSSTHKKGQIRDHGVWVLMMMNV